MISPVSFSATQSTAFNDLVSRPQTYTRTETPAASSIKEDKGKNSAWKKVLLGTAVVLAAVSSFAFAAKKGAFKTLSSKVPSDFLKKVFDGLDKAGNKIADTAKKGLSIFTKKSAETAQTITEGAKDAADDVAQAVVEGAKGAADDVAQAVVEGAKGAADDVAQAVVEGAKGAADDVAQAVVEGAKGTADDAAKTVAEGTKEGLKEVVEGAGDGIRQVVDNTKNFFKGAIEKVTEAVENVKK